MLNLAPAMVGSAYKTLSISLYPPPTSPALGYGPGVAAPASLGETAPGFART